MKKIGFTLAEVLITLTIVGVVAALTAPALSNSVQKSKVGPSLRKFITTMENANRQLMAEHESDSIYNIANTSEMYLEEIGKYISGAPANKTVNELDLIPTNFQGKSANALYYMELNHIYDLTGGDSFSVSIWSSDEINDDKSRVQGSSKGLIATVYYDLNGFANKPNRIGKDIFHLYFEDGGTVIPDGGKMKYRLRTGEESEQVWKDSSWNKCDETEVGAGHSCAGSIADNNWKVIYKY